MNINCMPTTVNINSPSAALSCNLNFRLREFINTHLNEARNRIIRMNLFMEMFTLGVTFAACASSIFGMNLNSRNNLMQNDSIVNIFTAALNTIDQTNNELMKA